MKQVPVCIALNDHEASKAKISDNLMQSFENDEIHARKVAADKNVAKKLLELSPKVLIVDYLLGDFGTGLDLVEQLQEQPVAQPAAQRAATRR